MPDSRIFARALFGILAVVAFVGIAMVLVAEDAEAVTSISLSIQGSDTQSVTPGSSATFKINVTNTLTTTQLTVNLTRSTPPSYWTAQLSQSQISVPALATRSVTLTVGVPANASADSVGKQIIVTATPDFGDTEQITTTTKVSQTYGIQTSTPTASKNTVGGATVTFSLVINNTGNGADTVTVSHSGEPSSWTVSHVSSVTVPAAGSRSVTVTVVPPSNATAGTYQTTVKATSSDGTTNDQTTFIIIVGKVYGLTLSSSDVSKYVTPNTPTYYNLSITNTGNTADNAIIGIVNAPAGWTVLPTSNPVFLNPLETKAFQVLVTAPNTALAGTQVQITVNATSNGNSSIVRQLSINAVVNQVYDPRVTPQTNSQVIAPGSSGIFKINVSNQGNGNDTIDLGLSGVPSGQGWVFNFNPVSVALTPGQTKTVDLTFAIGSKAAFGDNLITVIGTSHGTSNTGTTPIVVSISQFYSLAMVPVGASTQRVDPGGSITFNFSATNTGNGPDDITFSVLRLDSSWVSYFSKTTIYNLPANGTDTTTLTIEVPSTSNSGTYRFDVRAVSDGDTSVSRTVLNLTIIVNQLFSVDIEPGSYFINGEPGIGSTLSITVTNDGSGKDNVTMSVPGPNASWVAFDLSTVALDPGMSTTVTATITPPAGTIAGDVTITFRGTSKGRTSVYDEAIVAFTVNKVYSALLGAVESEIHKKPTETATFTVRLKNEGNDADTFKVNFTSNPRSLASYSLSSPFVTLGVSATRTFTVTVTVPSGEPVGNLQFVLLATSGNDTAASSSVTLTVIVDPVYGVNLYSYAATASAQPTDSDMVELRVENIGNGQDTYSLKATGQYYRWASFESTLLTVGAGGEILVNMTVTVPDGMATGTYTIDVVATSTGASSATKTLVVTVTVEHKEDVEVTAANLIRKKSTDPGGTVTYDVKVTNLGLKAHVVDISLEGIHASWGKLNRTQVILAAGASDNVLVTVSIPEGTTPMSFDINVTGTFDDMSTRTDTLNTITTVNTVQGVEVELNDTTVTGLPGTTVTVTLNVKNTGNAEETFDFSVDVSEDFVAFSPTTLTLAPGVDANVTVRLTAPNDPLTPTGIHYINITATSQSNISASDSDLMEFEVDQVYVVSIKATPLRHSVDPGTNAQYNITITNDGNGDDTFVLTLDGARKAWGRLSQTQVNLGQGGEKIIVLTVRVPSNQPVEDGEVIVVATSSGGDNVTAQASTTTSINPFYGVSLTVSNPSKKGIPGRSVLFSVKVKNTGNSQDTFNFEMEGDFASWAAPMDPLTIDAGKTKTLEVNITPPDDIANGVYNFVLNASSETQGDAFDLLDLDVTIKVFYLMDVTISKTEINSSPDAPETVRVYVENLGNVNDTYDLRPLGPYTSWVTMDNTTLEVDDGATGVSTASILVNATFSGEYKIRFEVTSHGGDNVTEVFVIIKIELTYGVTLDPRRDDYPAAPDTSVRIEVKLTNDGNVEDTYALSIAQLPGSLWDAQLEFNSLNVVGGEEAYFNVTVDVPAGVEAGTYKVNVRAVSTVSPLDPIPSDTVALNISIAFAVNATGPEDIISVFPGDSATTQIIVENEGLGRDAFQLKIDEDYVDWAVLESTVIVLSAGEMGSVDVYITPPNGAKTGTYVIQVTVTSVGDDSVFDIADIRVKVRQVYGVIVEPASTWIEGPDNVYHTADLVVTNIGNGEDTIRLEAILPPGVPIEAGFDRDTLTLDAGKNTTVTIRIKAVKGTNADIYIIDVMARSSSSSVDAYHVTVNYEIPSEYGVNMRTNAGLDEVLIYNAVNGRDYDFTIEVFNTGNIQDTYGMSIVSDDAGMPSWFTFESTEITLDSGKSQLMIVTVSIPFDAIADQYLFGVQASSTSVNMSAVLNGTIEVSADRLVTLTCDKTEDSVNPSGGTSGSATFTITVHNDGNVQESITFDVTYPPSWGPYTMTPETVTVDPYGTATVLLEFPPSSVPGNAATVNPITVKARYGPEISDPLNLIVRVLQSDVDVKEVLLSDYNPKDDGIVDVTVTLINTGDVDATGLTLVLIVNDIEVTQVPSQSVPANSQRLVLINWEVDEDPGATLTLKIRIPQEDITYTVPETVTVQEVDDSLLGTFEDLGAFTMLGFGLIMGLLLGLIIVAIVHKGNKKRVEAARASGMAEGLTFADSEEAEKEPPTEDAEGEEEDEMDTEEDLEDDLEEDEIEEGEPEEDEDATPVTVQCPKCDTHNVVTTSQRPYEFRCEKCNALLRLSR